MFLWQQDALIIKMLPLSYCQYLLVLNCWHVYKSLILFNRKSLFVYGNFMHKTDRLYLLSLFNCIYLQVNFGIFLFKTTHILRIFFLCLWTFLPIPKTCNVTGGKNSIRTSLKPDSIVSLPLFVLYFDAYLYINHECSWWDYCHKMSTWLPHYV